MPITNRFFVSLLVLFGLSFFSIAVAEKVVVIPLNSSKASVEKEMYLPAHLFRTTTSSLAWSWEEEGSVINPGGLSYWIAPILLPAGTTIISLELFWKNNVFNFGTSRIQLYVFNLLNAQGGSTGLSSTISTDGVQSVIYDNPNIPITDNYKFSAQVFLSNTNRWLMGVKVIYRE